MNTFISYLGLTRVVGTSFKVFLWPCTTKSKALVLSRHPAVASINFALLPGVCARHYGSKGKKPGAVVELLEGEKDLINMEKVEEGMTAAVSWLKQTYTTTVTTRFTPSVLDKITVNVEGKNHQLKKVAQLSMPNPQTILINVSSYPELVNEVAKEIHGANIGLNPVVEKTLLKVLQPKVTGEMREKLAKSTKSYSETAKKRVGRSRDDGVKELKKKKKTISEDSYRRVEKYLQQMTNKYCANIEELAKAKITELTKGS